jgi:hypothetical protein
MHEELFTAIKNQGTFLNSKRIHVSTTNTLNNAIAHQGDFAKGNTSETTHRYIRDILTLARRATALTPVSLLDPALDGRKRSSSELVTSGLSFFSASQKGELTPQKSWMG